MTYTVARAFTDIDGHLKPIGSTVELALDRAIRLKRGGYIVGTIVHPVPPIPWQMIHGSGRRVTSREENIAGLASAITLANEIRADLTGHYADVGAHTTAADGDNIVVAPAALDLPMLLTLTTEMLTSYAAHHLDSRTAGPGPWLYHDAQGTDYTLASAVGPINLQETITKLNDLKAKYNNHEADNTAHGTISADTVTSGNAAYGVAIRVPIARALSEDMITWGILLSGTGTVTGVSAVPGNGFVDFTFSADPQNDAVISYMVSRPIYHG